MRKATPINIGDRYGSLMVIEDSQEKRRGEVLWKCRCDCGNYTNVVGSKLRSGHTTSCGCKSSRNSIGKRVAKDLTGQRFGRLLAIKLDDEKSSDGKNLWLCRCECGNNIKVRASCLLSGHTKSCGCYKRDLIAENGNRDMKQCLEFLKSNVMVEGTNLYTIGRKINNANNSSGYRGVCFDKDSGSWRAYIGFRKHQYKLGRYKDIEDAVSARKKAEEHLYGNFLNWYVETYPDEWSKVSGKIMQSEKPSDEDDNI